MKIAVLGTGIVGTTLGTKLVERGHEVMMGSRTRGNGKAKLWSETTGPGASHGTFAEAAEFGEVILNCTAGIGTLEALRSAGAGNLSGKILIDVANPLDFSRGMPPTLTVCNTDSLGEQVQRAFPEARVVKALNTMNCGVMVDPGRVPGEHHLFLCGDDPAAKRQVGEWLMEWFGWTPAAVIDLGDISASRGTEMVLPLWIRIMMARQSADFNFHVAAASTGAA